MKKILEVCAIFAFVIYIYGCATVPVAPTSADPVPADRLLAFQEKKANDTAIIIATRDEGLLGSGCFYALAINGVLAARFDTGETAKFFVEPGEIRLRIGRDPQGRGLCAAGQEYWTQRETILRDREIKYFRLLIDASGRTDIQRSE